MNRLWAGWRARYVSEEAGRQSDCFLCALDTFDDAAIVCVDTLVLERSEHCLVIMNLYPYGSGHVLVAPRRHIGQLDALADDEAIDLMRAQQRAVRAIGAAFGPDGINLGANLGRAAGAGIPDHLHVHVLPRWEADTNFMTSVANTRVLPQSLDDGWAKLHAAWPVAGQ